MSTKSPQFSFQFHKMNGTEQQLNLVISLRSAAILKTQNVFLHPQNESQMENFIEVEYLMTFAQGERSITSRKNWFSFPEFSVYSDVGDAILL